MQFMIFVLAFVAALLALEGLSELLSHRKDPARVRKRLSNLASRVGNVEMESGESILRRQGSSRIRKLLELELLLYRAGIVMGVRRFLAPHMALLITAMRPYCLSRANATMHKHRADLGGEPCGSR